MGLVIFFVMLWGFEFKFSIWGLIFMGLGQDLNFVKVLVSYLGLLVIVMFLIGGFVFLIFVGLDIDVNIVEDFIFKLIV